MSNTIRLFVSSTFADMKAERNVLQENVFPKLRQLCLSHGMRFQAIDLRWGIPEDAGKDNCTMRICLRELKRCQEGRLKPNFLILLGNRYGWRPLPETIPASLFAILREKLSGPMLDQLEWREDQPVESKGWYRRDDNAEPSAYELRPRGDYPEWHQKVAWPLLAALEEAVRQIGIEPGHYGVAIGASATEQEITAGALTVSDASEHVYAFFREMDGMPDGSRSADYRDLDEHGRPDTYAQDRLEDLKTRIERRLGENVVPYHVPWRDSGVDPADLAQLEKDVYVALSGVILKQIESLAAGSLESREEEAHRAFGDERCHGFIGREEPLQKIAKGLGGASHTLAVIGPAGSGKSALMAEAARRARVSFGEENVLARFIGSTPNSTSLIALLSNLVAEIRRRYPGSQPTESDELKDGPIPSGLFAMVNAFLEALSRPSPERPLYLFLDALDQLSPDDNALALHWLPADPGPNTLLVLSTALPSGAEAGELDPRAIVIAALDGRLGQISQLMLSPLTTQDGSILLSQWLARVGRTLQPPQKEAIMKAFAQEGLPLWLRVATEESLDLASWEPARAFSSTLLGLLQQVLAHLSKERHGDALVAHVLANIVSARHGLAEDEVLDVLSADEAVMAEFRRRSPDSPSTDTLPVAVWVRLYGDIAPYLTEHSAQSASLLAFYHRSFLEAVRAAYAAGAGDRLAAHQRLADYFGRREWFIAPTQDDPKAPRRSAVLTDPPDARRASELPRHLLLVAVLSDSSEANPPAWDALAGVLCDAQFVEAKCRAGLVFELQEDYRDAIVALPEAQSDHDEEAKRQARMDRWINEIIAFARAWSERRDRTAGGEALTEPEPEMPNPPPVCWLIPKDKMLEEYGRALHNPTRRESLQQIAEFVAGQAYALSLYGKFTAFVMQQAYSWDSLGVVHDRAANVIKTLCVPTLLRTWPDGHLPLSNSSQVRVLGGHNGSVLGVRITSDGKRTVSASEDKTLRIWDLDNGNCLHVLEGHDGSVSCVCLTADGLRALSGSDDGTLRLWCVDTGRCLQILDGGSSVRDVSITPDGRLAISACEDQTLRLWDTKTGALLRFLTLGEGCECVCITSDGRLAVSGGVNRIIVWDLATGVQLRTLGGNEGPECIAITNDGSRVLAGTFEGKLKTWEIATGKCVGSLGDDLIFRDGRAQNFIDIRSIALSGDGSRAILVSQNRSVRVMDLQSGECLLSLQGHSDMVLTVDLTPDAHRAVTGSSDYTVRVWDIAYGLRPLDIIYHRDSINGVAVTPDGRRAVSGGHDRMVQIWDANRAEHLWEMEGHRGDITGMSVTQDGLHAVSAAIDDTIRVWDLSSGECISVAQLHEPTGSLECVKVTDRRAWTVCGHGRLVHVFGANNFGRAFRGHAGDVNAVSVTPDGRRVISGSADKTIRIWDIETGRCLKSLLGHQGAVNGVDITADGNWAISGSDDKTIRVWSLETGGCTHTLEAHSARVNCVCLTPNGWRAVSASDDKTIRVWDMISGACIALFYADARIRSVSAGSECIVAGAEDGSVFFLHMRGFKYWVRPTRS